MKLARGASRQYHLVNMVQAKPGRVDRNGAGYAAGRAEGTARRSRVGVVTPRL